MTREEAIKTWLPIISMSIDNMPELKEAFDMAIKALERESTFQKKAEIVISQLRADRDRLQDAFDKVRAEIKQYQSDYDVHGTEYDRTAWKAFNRCLQIIDKCKA